MLPDSVENLKERTAAAIEDSHELCIASREHVWQITKLVATTHATIENSREQIARSKSH